MPEGSSEAVYEMIWDCKFCGQKKLLGLTHRFCAGCGAPQDPAARYFPPDSEKVAVNDHEFVGADVACPACKQPMGRAAKCCTNCGSPIDKGAEVQRRADVVLPDPGHPAAAGGGGFAAGRYGPDALAAQAAAPPVNKPFPIVLAIIGAIVVLAIASILVAVFWKRDAALEVIGHAWERNIAIERFETGKKSAWCDERPAGGREIGRRREQRSTTQVKDGETCQTRKKDQGNGTFKEVRECQPKFKTEPVMSDRCDFEVTDWRAVRTVGEKGTSPKDPPKWPAVGALRAGSCLGCEREGPRTEKYTVKFKDSKGKGGDAVTCDVPEARWAKFEKGSRWKGAVRVLTSGVDCDSLARQ